MDIQNGIGKKGEIVFYPILLWRANLAHSMWGVLNLGETEAVWEGGFHAQETDQLPVLGRAALSLKEQTHSLGYSWVHFSVEAPATG